jgi:hypothetical protein
MAAILKIKCCGAGEAATFFPELVPTFFVAVLALVMLQSLHFVNSIKQIMDKKKIAITDADLHTAPSHKFDAVPAPAFGSLLLIHNTAYKNAIS